MIIDQLSSIKNSLVSFAIILDKIDFLEFQDFFELHRGTKGLYICDSVQSEISKTEVILKKFCEGINSPIEVDMNAICELCTLAAQVLLCFIKIVIQLVELNILVRSTEVLLVIREIDFSKPINKLNEIDKKLNQFVEFNHLESMNEFDFYPMPLIRSAREQLNRISLNYGRESEFKKNGDLYTDFEEIIEFPVDIFLTQNNYKLFIYLVDKYATGKRPVDFSHIFRWMEENNLTAKRIGKKYMNYCIDNHLVNGKFTRISDPDPRTRTPLNELYKAFKLSRVKTSK